MEVARKKNKIRFDKTHRLRPKKIEEGDWVLVVDEGDEISTPTLMPSMTKRVGRNPQTRAMSTRKRTKPIYHRSQNLTLLLGTYQRTCSLVGVDVVKIFGNSVKNHVKMTTKYKAM